MQWESGQSAFNQNKGMPAAPPLGAIQSTDASQTAPSHLMANQQQILTDQDGVYQQSRSSLLGMLNLAKNQTGLDTITRLALPDSLATRVNSDAAEYQKQHANYVSLQGKALGGGGTDTARATIDESVPDFGKPQAAKIFGLNTQLNQIDMNHLKRQVVTGAFQNGDQSAYTGLSNQFDNIVNPSMMPQLNSVIGMPAGPQRGTLLKQLSADPKMNQVLHLLANQGVLK